MQISSSVRNAYTTTALSKSAQTVTTVTTSATTQETNTINKDAYNYFDLGEDVS